MMNGCGGDLSRRQVLGHAALGIAGGLAALQAAKAALGQGEAQTVSGTNRTFVALTHGNSRADNVYKALKLIEPQVKQGLAKKKRVVIKPNLVSTEVQLSAPHVDCLRGILEFLKPLVKDEVLIAESAGTGPTIEGYNNYKYEDLKKDYRVRLLDLDDDASVIEHVVDGRFHSVPVRVSKLLVDAESYVISSAILKTHICAATTLGIKNMTFGSMLKNRGFRWGAEPGNPNSDKPRAHGGDNSEGIHFNMLMLAKRVRAHLSVLDGFQGMEGNGPIDGTAVDHRIAIASTDWLSADRLGVELMGFDFNKVAYLRFCGEAGIGQADLGKMEILGERMKDHVRTYRPADNIAEQYRRIWG